RRVMNGREHRIDAIAAFDANANTRSVAARVTSGGTATEIGTGNSVLPQKLGRIARVGTVASVNRSNDSGPDRSQLSQRATDRDIPVVGGAPAHQGLD